MKADDEVYVQSPRSEGLWVRTWVSRLISRVGGTCVGFEVKYQEGLFLFEDVVGGSSGLDTWYLANGPIDRCQMSSLWKKVLGNAFCNRLAREMRVLLNDGRSDSDVITDLLGLFPAVHEIGVEHVGLKG